MQVLSNVYIAILILCILSTSTHAALWFPAFIVALVFATAAVEVSKAVALNTDIKDDGFTQTSKETETGKLDGKEESKINVDVGKEQEVSDETEVAHVDGVSDLDEGYDTDFDNRVFKRHTTVRGHLYFDIKYARNLPDPDGWWGRPDPYVKVVAVKPSGTQYTKTTRYKKNTYNPTWNSRLDMRNGGCEWTHFKVRIWDHDVGRDDAISTEQTFDVTSGFHSDVKHCTSNSCNGYMYFDYRLTPDGNECSSNPCQNGGTCYDVCVSFTCDCTGSYTGSTCRDFIGVLDILARDGSGLPDRDGFGGGDSDPYMEVIAYDIYGSSVRKTTSTDRNDESPSWNQNLVFGSRAWKRFTVRVWDKDIGRDDALSSTQTVYLPSNAVTMSDITHYAYSGSVEFDYRLH